MYRNTATDLMSTTQTFLNRRSSEDVMKLTLNSCTEQTYSQIVSPWFDSWVTKPCRHYILIPDRNLSSTRSSEGCYFPKEKIREAKRMLDSCIVYQPWSLSGLVPARLRCSQCNLWCWFSLHGCAWTCKEANCFSMTVEDTHKRRLKGFCKIFDKFGRE